MHTVRLGAVTARGKVPTRYPARPRRPAAPPPEAPIALLATLTELKRHPDAVAPIPVPELGLVLRLVDTGDLDDADLIERLGTWRAASMPNYPTQFPVTSGGTRRWLRDLVLGDADRLMFLIVDPGDPRGPAFGHLGFDHADADGRFIHLSNVVSGDRERLPPGAMEIAERRMLDWGYATLGVGEIRARIFTDNRPARRLHERLGFQEIGRIGLRRHTEPGRVVFLPCAPDDDAPPDRWWVELAERAERR